MKTQIVMAGLTLALMMEAPSLWAADPKADLEKSVVALDKAELKPEGQTRVLEGISKDTGVPVKTLTEQRDKTKLGYGGLFIANALAKETGKTFDQIVALHKGGMGWGQIAHENNVKLGPIVSQAKRSEQAAERAKNTDKTTEGKKPGKVSDGDKPDKKSPPPTRTKPAPSGGGGKGGGRGK